MSSVQTHWMHPYAVGPSMLPPATVLSVYARTAQRPRNVYCRSFFPVFSTKVGETWRSAWWHIDSSGSGVCGAIHVATKSHPGSAGLVWRSKPYHLLITCATISHAVSVTCSTLSIHMTCRSSAVRTAKKSTVIRSYTIGTASTVHSVTKLCRSALLTWCSAAQAICRCPLPLSTLAMSNPYDSWRSSQAPLAMLIVHRCVVVFRRPLRRLHSSPRGRHLGLMIEECSLRGMME